MIKNIKRVESFNQIKYCLIVLVLASYVFRGVAIKIGIAKLCYIFTASLFFLCLIQIKGKITIRFEIMIFIFSGLISLIWSILYLNTSVLMPFAGYLSIYMNFFAWLLFFETLNDAEKEVVLDSYKKIIVFFAEVSALLGIYQTFVDASIGGYAFNKIYSNNELMSYGSYVRRATALFGSPQNYALFIAIGFCLAVFMKFKHKITKIMCIVILFLGIIVSGSRAASLGIVVSIICLMLSGGGGGRFDSKMFLVGTIVMLLLFGIAVCAHSIVNSETLNRLTNFKVHSSAQNAYLSAFEDLPFLCFFFGRGVGYRNWVVYSFLGDIKYTNIFKAQYKSIESTFLTIFANMGIIGIISFVYLVILALEKAVKKGPVEYSVIIVLIINCIYTPSFMGMAINFIMWPFLLGNILQPKNHRIIFV